MQLGVGTEISSILECAKETLTFTVFSHCSALRSVYKRHILQQIVYFQSAPLFLCAQNENHKNSQKSQISEKPVF